MGNYPKGSFVANGLSRGKRLDDRGLFQTRQLKAEHDIFQQCFGSSRFESRDIEIVISITEVTRENFSFENFNCIISFSRVNANKDDNHKGFSRYFSECITDMINKLFHIFRSNNHQFKLKSSIQLDVVVSFSTEITLEILFKSCIEALLNCQLPDKEQNESKNMFVKSLNLSDCNEYHAINIPFLFLKDPSSAEKLNSSMSIFLLKEDNLIKTILKEDVGCFEFNDFLKLFQIKPYY